MAMLTIIHLSKGNDSLKDPCNFCKQKLHLTWNWPCNNVENFHISPCKRRHIPDDAFKQAHTDYDHPQERTDAGEYGERRVQTTELHALIHTATRGSRATQQPDDTENVTERCQSVHQTQIHQQLPATRPKIPKVNINDNDSNASKNRQ